MTLGERIGVDLGGRRRLEDSHLKPGDGTIDFRRLFARLEDGGYRGHYMLAFGSLDDMLAGREHLVRVAGR